MQKGKNTGVEVTCHSLRYGHAAGVPGPHPIHILGEIKEQTYSYTFHSETCTHSYTNFQILPFHILGGLRGTPHPVARLHIPL